MKALIWKELRENLKWAPLPGLVIFVVCLIDRPDEAMLDVTEAYFFYLTAAVFGAALGFVQIFFEAQGDKRSLLLHRPLSRSRIFLAKALVGVGIYLLASGVPFLCLESWLALPGHIPAPYHWRTSLPWLADILSGLVYYFAGMLTAQREARWYGSRCLGLAAAFGCSYFVWIVPEFWQAVLVIGIIGSFVAVAAWGSFSAGGAYAPQPPLAKGALAITILAGLLILCMFGKQVIGDWLDPGIHREYLIDRQGRLLSAPFRVTVGALGPWTDESGQQPPDLRGQLVDSRVTALYGAMETPLDWSYRNNGRFYIKCLNDSTAGQEVWYYDQARRRLFGYDKVFHHSLGSFGPDGFAPPGQQPDDHFHGELRYRSNRWSTRYTEYLTFSDGVYTVDFTRRTIRLFFTPQAGETVRFADSWKEELDRKCRLVGVSTDKSFYVMRDENAPVASVPRLYREKPGGIVYLGLLENPERYLVWYQAWRSLLEPEEVRRTPTYLLEYDTAGHELAHRKTVPPPPVVTASYAQALFGLITPMTEAGALVGACKYLRSEARGQGRTRKPVLLSSLEHSTAYIPGTSSSKGTPSGLIPAYLALMLLSAAASALGCFLLAYRHAFSRVRCCGWALAGFFFGWVGLLLMFAIQEWPARIPCPKCGKLRVVSRDTCEHCGALHAAPALDGTEIFEPTAANACVDLATH
jgi:hypothetical protein